MASRIGEEARVLAVAIRCGAPLGVEVAFPMERQAAPPRFDDRDRADLHMAEGNWPYFARVWAARADARRAIAPELALRAELLALRDLSHDTKLGAIARRLLQARGW